MKKLTIAIAFSLLTALSLLGATEAQIKSSISARSAQVKTLWMNQIAGVDNSGYLTIRVDQISDSDSKVVLAENSDRKTLYLLIAKRTNQSVGEIEKISAKALHRVVPSGTWIQKPDGSWIMKK